MAYTLLYHPEVLNDLKLINLDVQKRIVSAIEKRLQTAPEQYGKPLRKTLKGYWKLRVGDYRIVFKIAGQEIWIYGIINRRDVYGEIQRRLPWEPHH